VQCHRLRETLRLKKAKLSADHSDTLMTMNNLAKYYSNAGRAADALSLLKETLERRQRRLDADPGNRLEQAYLAHTHAQVGEAERDLFHYAAAVAAYGKSAELFNQLDQAAALKDPFFRGTFNVCRQQLARCRKAEQAVKDLSFVLKQPAVEVPGLLDMRVQAMAAEKNQAGVVATAEAYARIAEKDTRYSYNAGCAWSLAAGLAQSPVAGDPGYEEYAGKALALLKKTPTGPGQFFATPAALAAHMKQDTDLDALRQRDDFKKLLAELEGKTNDKPPMPHKK
jgi:hypothetical protein